MGGQNIFLFWDFPDSKYERRLPPAHGILEGPLVVLADWRRHSSECVLQLNSPVQSDESLSSDWGPHHDTSDNDECANLISMYGTKSALKTNLNKIEHCEVVLTIVYILINY